MISKEEIADTLGIDSSTIEDAVYKFAKAQFFILTHLKEEEESRTYTKFVSSTTQWLKLKDKNIKSIDSITIGDTSITIGDNVDFNSDTGLVYYSGGFAGGYKVVVTYTINSYTHETIHDYLIMLLTLKQLGVYTPNLIQNVSSIKIGTYSKTLGSASKNMSEFIGNLNTCIDEVIAMIFGDNRQLDLDAVV